MYIKFCRSYVEDKKDEVGEKLASDLSVELDGEKGKQTEGNERLYRAACLLLSVICLILLFVIITLSVKLQTGSPVCSEKEETTPADKQIPSPTCSPEQCQDLFPNIHSERISCQQCTKGWLTYGQSCYFLSTFRLPWAESQQNCTTRGGSLAVINSWNVQNFLTRKGNLKYWIGLRERDAAWNWVNNKKLRESYWAEHPNNGDCALLSTDDQPQKNWDRAPCQAATYFICQLQF
ncbi:C-type lectin domain family 4 member E isoform X2 [Leuresthes tenuis]|uniref:C-type lectin domain family 4 member E isoform X2 n=1 Tax=Leuresthes tenuis TaxID=355514 RepID=UPI003B507FDD